MWENVNDSQRILMCWKKQLPYRNWLPLTGEVLERSRVAKLYFHHPRQSLKMPPSLITVPEKDEASSHLAALPISSTEKFLSNTRSRD